MKHGVGIVGIIAAVIIITGIVGDAAARTWYNTRQDVTNMLRDNPDQAKQDLRDMLESRTIRWTDENGAEQSREDMTHFDRLGLTAEEVEEMVR